jgi:hypothetical protein
LCNLTQPCDTHCFSSGGLGVPSSNLGAPTIKPGTSFVISVQMFPRIPDWDASGKHRWGACLRVGAQAALSSAYAHTAPLSACSLVLCWQPGDTKMFGKTKVALSTAIVLSTAFPALAATKHHPVTRVPTAIYNTAPDTTSGTCSPIPRTGVRLCDNVCTGSGPCAPPDHD